MSKRYFKPAPMQETIGKLAIELFGRKLRPESHRHSTKTCDLVVKLLLQVLGEFRSEVVNRNKTGMDQHPASGIESEISKH
ncbi:MAG: hypothetical protein R3C11_16335 [Planctomycetaceae bacterium]